MAQIGMIPQLRRLLKDKRVQDDGEEQKRLRGTVGLGFGGDILGLGFRDLGLISIGDTIAIMENELETTMMRYIGLI